MRSGVMAFSGGRMLVVSVAAVPWSGSRGGGAAKMVARWRWCCSGLEMVETKVMVTTVSGGRGDDRGGWWRGGDEGGVDGG
ncbi:hypothetical protein Tco_1532705 [Tanacetum coccineum]